MGIDICRVDSDPVARLCLSFRNRNREDRTLVHLRKHWDIIKSRRKRQLVEETMELMSTGRGPYNSHKPSCPKVEVVAPPL
uniref:Uncharacterized protein n=1 Tax=Timema monikensis TaxID=170555 RepID=A0A7R9HUX8_9NEOP|nr:unnamed protein product [Timema monikensis]